MKILVDTWHAVPPLIIATEPVTYLAEKWQGILNLNSELAAE